MNAAPATEAVPKSRATAGGRLLQRKCACGNASSGITRKCGSCERKQALGLPAKLVLGEPGDALEREADGIAARVLESTAAAPRRVSPAPVPRIDRRAAAGAMANTAPASVAATLARGGEALSPGTRAFFEPRFGHDFARVRVHRDAAAAQSARDVAAHAYTVGHHVVFASGQYAPETVAGRRLIAHELAHVLQQSGADADGDAPVLVQRACDQPESFYRDSPNFCRDDRFSPNTHPGKTCYRELLPEDAEGCPPGDHCCFSPDGTVESSFDSSRLADEKDDDGSCGWDWGCVAKHTATDFLPAVTGLDCFAACRGVPGAGKLWCLQSCWARK
jgi:hypothetical protein